MGIPNADDLTRMTKEADEVEKTTAVENWGDKQQYHAEPHQGDPNRGVEPEVYLVSMTADPLGVMAALNGIYGGKVNRSTADVTDDERYQALHDMQNSHLTAPLETIDLHFLIDGVDRAFTHQLVRQRTAMYGQESMRFAVLGDLIDATTLPPSLQGTERAPEAIYGSLKELKETRAYQFLGKQERQRMKWDWLIRQIDNVYHELVEDGMPAEEARGLLPHATATRIHFKTDLRAIIPHAGNRLCTQAQFHWRMVWTKMLVAIRNAVPEDHPHRWQYEAIAGAQWFRPACYQLGHCPFKGTFDRACSIRPKVDELEKQGVPTNEWDTVIPVSEWLMNPGAARI